MEQLQTRKSGVALSNYGEPIPTYCPFNCQLSDELLVNK